MLTACLAILCVLLMLVLLVQRPAIWPVLVVLAAAWCIGMGLFRYRLRSQLARWVCGGDFTKSKTKFSLEPLSQPVVLLSGETVLWYNDQFRQRMLGGQDLLVSRVQKVIPGLDLQQARTQEGQQLTLADGVWSAHSSTVPGDAETMTLVVFNEETALRRVEAEYKASRPGYLVFLVDGYDDVFSDMLDSERARLLEGINRVLEDMIGRGTGFLRRVASGRYIAVVEERHLEQYAQRGATAEVSMTMNAEGTQEWSRMTGENIGKCIAIVLDGYVYSAPRVNGKIDKGQSSITGDFTIQEAKDLANVLNSGKVPAPAKIIQDTVVGPSLGQESINAGMLSFVIAFILVLLYMGLFYKTAGWMSDIALLFNVFLLMGVLVSFGAVLTLPGIAGIVLTMGMAVDANVIIYERIKEELRGGKGLSLAIKDGFSKAYSAIIDGNLTTIITGIVLFIFGNGPVQGFATTLIIGIVTSFFCAIFITRLLIEWIVAKWGNIAFSHKWSENFLNNTHVDFLSKRKISYTIVVVLMVLSFLSLAVRGLNLGAEFTGGRAYVVRFDKAVSAEAVRQNLDEAFSAIADADASSVSFEVKQYGNENQMRIVTQYRYDDTSDEATAEVEQILYNALKSLYSYDITFEQFRNTQTDQNGILNADKIGPSIAQDMTWNAIYSVLFSLIAIGLYITFRFKRWQWATGATAALAFNALLIIGIFSMFYGLLPFNLEVNQAFIAAILTIIGYAINDTVVVFDRIREYMTLYPKRNLADLVNGAINSTLSRTINTSGTTLVTLLAIVIFGGETIRGFIFALIIGVVVGVAATIFIATPLAYDLMAKRMKKAEIEKK